MLAASRAWWRLGVGLSVAVAPFVLAAQSSAPADSALIIKGIEIQTHRIFDSAQATSIVYRSMNALHFTTQKYVIEQQLLFKVGQPWDSALVRETARNLRTLGLFREVRIDSVASDSGLIARVYTQDAWTLGIVFTIKSSGSQIGYAIGVNDRNFLGSGAQVQIQYGKNPDRDSVMYGVTRHFLFRSPLDLQFNYNHLSDGKTGFADLSLPFRTLETKTGATLNAQLYNGRVLLFYGGDTVATDTTRRSFQLLSLNPAIALHATDHSYVRLGMYAQIERNDFQAYSLPPDQIPQNYTGAIGPFISASAPLYEHVRYFQAGGRREDLQLGYTATFSLYYTPKQWGNNASGFSPTLLATAGQKAGRMIVQESLTVSSLYTTAGLDSGTVYGSVTAWTQPTPTQLLIAYAGAGWQKNGYPGENWDLGFGYAVRAFPQHSFTGDRVFITSGEYRWFFAPDVYRLFAVGFGVFADYAGSWYSGSPRRTGADAGVGLRFSSITGNPGYVMRADIAYRWPNEALPGGWVFTFGKGFVWQVF
jgi:hypothetical protein